MGKDLTCVVAGFGGQGSLFAGKVIATAGLIEDREVSWMPSYGPEMRGGTANCSVTLSDEPIGSPLITRPRALIALNQPSFDKFIDNVEEGGIVVVDTAMVPSLTEPEGVTVIGIPATKMCEEAGLKGLGNIVLIGKAVGRDRLLFRGGARRRHREGGRQKCPRSWSRTAKPSNSASTLSIQSRRSRRETGRASPARRLRSERNSPVGCSAERAIA